MILREVYQTEYIRALQERYRKDPSLLERVLFAFGLLEAIASVGMPFNFKFVYHSPLRDDEFYILLDIVFAENPYLATEQHEITNELLLTEGRPITVTVPSPECILGDKLTAFAPHTTGVPFGVNKELEIIKQLFDVALRQILVGVRIGGCHICALRVLWHLHIS